MELYNGETMPLSDDPKLRLTQEKILRGESLSLLEKLIAGRDHPVKVINGYELKPDHAYRAVSKELFELYQQKGCVCGFSEDDEYEMQIEDGKYFHNNKGIDWYLGGVDPRYGEIILECPANKEYFTPTKDNGSGMAIDPTIRHLKSSGHNKPIPISMLTNIISKESSKEQIEEFKQARIYDMEQRNILRRQQIVHLVNPDTYEKENGGKAI